MELKDKLKLLNKLFTNPKSPVCFSGIDPLYKEAHKIESSITKRDVIYYLEGNRTYALHKPRRIHFQRSKTIPSNFMSDVQIDLADFQKLSKHNKGNKYMLVGIDVLSKRIFASPVKSKNNKDMQVAMDSLLNQMPVFPNKIFSDKGTEFSIKINKTKKSKGDDYFDSKDILKYKSSTKEIKASLAENCIKRIKQRLYRYFSEKHTLNWIDVLDDIVNSMNHSYSRPINMRPIDVNFNNSEQVWQYQYGNEHLSHTKPKFKEGDSVRMKNYKEIFDKGYLPNWSDEILTIDKVKNANPVYYKVKDDNNEQFFGNYYNEDLSRVRRDKDTTYRINILKSRIKKGKKEYYVEFVGYKNARQWIPESFLEK